MDAEGPGSDDVFESACVASSWTCGECLDSWMTMNSEGSVSAQPRGVWQSPVGSRC